ncbi:MAG: FecR domain-containing protein [Bacteroidales bacterium]|nr:FecR domain-containing protein [Bacteroidales bacterium]
MKDNNWDIIAKDLAGETNDIEKAMVIDMRNSDSHFNSAYIDSEIIWNSISKPNMFFDKKRIVYIRDKKILKAKKQKANRIIAKALQYAAVFIGLLAAILFTYNDITKEIILTADNSKNILLPDGSEITLNSDAVISYNNSFLLGFNRRVNIIEGSAYFDISKQKGDNFVVNTENYNIEVLGTKFTVESSNYNTVVTLNEGRIKLCEYSAIGVDDIIMLPGDEVTFGNKMTKPNKRIVNTNVTNYWMKTRLDFDDYSLEDLKLIFRTYYNKELVLNESEVQYSNIRGSAPTDDVELIVKALSRVFKKELVIKEDSIIIK